MLPENPAAFSNLFNDDPTPRTKALNDKRLAVIWQALSDVPRGHENEVLAIGCKLHFVTLQRPSEIVRASLSDFDWADSTWRPSAESTKTKSEYFVPLSEVAIVLFRRLFEISGGEKAFPNHVVEGGVTPTVLSSYFVAVRERLFREGQLDSNDIDLYDGRRYGRTAIRKRLGFAKEVAERVINHKQKRDMSNLYDLDDYSEEVRVAQTKWSNELLRIVREADSRSSGTD